MHLKPCTGTTVSEGGGVDLLEILTSTKKKDYSYSYVLLCKICGVQPPTPVRF